MDRWARDLRAHFAARLAPFTAGLLAAAGLYAILAA
jgi:hypothetical protein